MIPKVSGEKISENEGYFYKAKNIILLPYHGLNKIKNFLSPDNFENQKALDQKFRSPQNCDFDEYGENFYELHPEVLKKKQEELDSQKKYSMAHCDHSAFEEFIDKKFRYNQKNNSK